MKRLSIYTRLSLAVALVGIFSGCDKEVQQKAEPVLEMRELTIEASMADAQPQSRNSYDENTRGVLWSKGDKISLFYGSGKDGGSEFTSQAEEPSKVTNFTGSIGVITGGADVSVDQTWFWGVYPYNETAECDGSSIVTTLPSKQVAVPGTFAGGTVISVGRSQGLTLAFYNVCSGIRVKVKQEGVRRLTFKSLDGSAVAGRARIALDADGIPYVSEILDGNDEIVLEAPAGETLVPGKNYYIMMFPHEFTSSFFSISFETMNKTATYERKRAMSFKRSNIEGFNVALDASLTYESKQGGIPIEDPAFKAYLVSNYDTDGDGEISYSEAEGITEIHIIPTNQVNIQSLQGIEYMPNLTVINCPGIWRSGLVIDSPYYYIGPYEDNWDGDIGPT